jgi:hypothetical protein
MAESEDVELPDDGVRDAIFTPSTRSSGQIRACYTGPMSAGRVYQMPEEQIDTRVAMS